MKIKVLSVAEVNNYIKKIVDNDFILNNLSVKGEISNLKYHSSGHIYFSLKDEKAKINCVMFKSDAVNLNFVLKEGKEVIIKGRASLYPAMGNIQLYCVEAEETGIGALHIKYERLKEKLYKEGLFDQKYKKQIPIYSKRIGVVTASTGAAIHDIINVSKRRNNLVDIVLYPAKVQGLDGYKTIIEGIEYFNKAKNVDVIIIGRGGGSLEELWNFNEEELGRSIFNSKIPIISGVGHEVDFTISDFVADFRAATPSQAAEIAVLNKNNAKMELDTIKSLLNKNLNSIIESKKRELNLKRQELLGNSPKNKIVLQKSKISQLESLINLKISKKIEMEKFRLSSLQELLNSRNPLNILNKGFTIIKDEKGTIKSKDELKREKEIEIIFKDGNVRGNFKPE